MKKKLLAMILIFSVVMSSLVGMQIVYAADSGTFSNITWEFDGVDTFTVSGNGPMVINKITNYVDRPWATYLPIVKHIVIESGITTIESGLFIDFTELVDVTIPDTLESLYIGAFPATSPKWERTIIDENNKNYVSVDGVVFTKDMTEIVRMPVAYSGEYVIPNTVKSIGERAFLDCESLTNITIPESVETIGKSAFGNCIKVEKVVIPESVETIGNSAFGGCIKMEKVVVPDSVKHLGALAFGGCSSLAEISIGSGVVNLGGSVLTATAYGKDRSNWFEDEGGKALYVGEYLIDAYSYGGVFTIKEGTKVIADSVFWFDDKLSGVNFPDSLMYIGDSSFEGCPLTSLDLPANLKSIGNEAFCVGEINNIKIPKSLEFIGMNAFGDNYVETIEVDDGNVHFIVNDNVLYSKDMTKIVMCPLTRTGKFAIPDTVTTIGPYAFYHCTMLKDIPIPQSVTYIGEGAFYECRAIRKAHLSDNVVFVGPMAFTNCTNLLDVKLPAELTEISVGLFSGCMSLRKLDIPKTVTAIGQAAFSSCAFENIELPNGIKRLERNVLASCLNLKTIDIPDTVEYIGMGAFYGSRALEMVHMPDNLKFIDEQAFNRCESLVSVDLPDGLEFIAYNPFSSCSSLEKATVPSSVKVAISTFYGCPSFSQILYTGKAEQFSKIDMIVEYEPVNATVIYNYERGTDVKIGEISIIDTTLNIPIYYVAESGRIITAVYNDDGALVYTALNEVKPSDTKATVNLENAELRKDYTIKVMCWSVGNDMTERCVPKEITIK